MRDDLKTPIPNAHVYFTDVADGVVTDFEGYFELLTEENHESFEVSYVGMKTQVISLKSRIKNSYKITMVEAGQLDEVVLLLKPKKRLKKKENPAYKILEKIWKNKRKNGLKLVSDYSYNRVRNMEIGLTNIDSTSLSKWIKDDFESLSKIIVQNKTKSGFYIPVFAGQTVRNFLGDNQKDLQVEKIIAKRSVGIEQNGFVFDRIQNVFLDIDVYSDDIPLVNRTFVSPISKHGYSVYHYVLNDSLETTNGKEYLIHFFPIEDGDLAFEGKFSVTAKDYALTHIEMRTNPKINLNLVQNLFLEKSFIIQDSIYLPLKDEYEADFTILTKSDEEKGLYVKQVDFFDKYELNKGIALERFENQEPQYRVDQFEQDETYWNKEIPVQADDQKLFRMVNQLKNVDQIKKISRNITILTSGFLPIYKSIQLGDLWRTAGSNEIQGTKIKVGFRTFTSQNDKFRFQSYLTHGLKNKSWNYGLSANFLIGNRPRVIFGVSYSDDLQQFGGKLMSEDPLVFDPFADALFKRGNNYFRTDIQDFKVLTDYAITKNLHLSALWFLRDIASADPDRFSIGYRVGSDTKNEYVDSGFEFRMIFTPKRKVFGYGVFQRFGNNLYPSTIIKLKKGVAGFIGSNLNYTQIQLSQNYPIKLSKFGILDATIEAGKSFDKVPLPSLFSVPANQTFSLEKNTFSLLSYYDFVTDTYFNTHLEHHFNGFVMNRLPYIKELKLRLLMTFRMAYGSLSNANKVLLDTQLEIQSPDQKPYYEYGFGFENLGLGQVRFFRLDFIWRSQYQALNGPQSPEMGVRVAFRPTF